MKNIYYFTKSLFAFTMAIFFGTAAATAQCVIPIGPGQAYSEDFESGQLECWTVESTGSASWTVMIGTLSSVAAFQGNVVGEASRLVSPTFDLTGSSSAIFSFAYAMMGLYDLDELEVSYRTSPADDWHQLDSYSFNDWSNTYTASFTIEDLSSTFQVSFLGHNYGGYYIFVDDIEIVSAGGCARPIGLQANDITATSALLEWSTSGNEEYWTLDLNGNTLTLDSQPFLFEGLRPQTSYTIKVKAHCGEGMESDWSQPITFKTLCDVIVVTDETPYFDDFEGSEEFLCWQDDIVAGSYGWGIDPGYLILNNTAFFIWMGEESWLISAYLDLTAVTNPILSFRHKQPVMEARVDELSVWYAASYYDSWHLLGEYTAACPNWETVSLALPNPSDSYLIAFRGKSNNADGVYVDDVFVGNGQIEDIVETPALAAFVSPNPTSGRVMVETNASDGEVTVFDLFGREVAASLLHEGRAEVDLSNCAKGVYVARIAGDGDMMTMKLVKE